MERRKWGQREDSQSLEDEVKRKERGYEKEQGEREEIGTDSQVLFSFHANKLSQCRIALSQVFRGDGQT